MRHLAFTSIFVERRFSLPGFGDERNLLYVLVLVVRIYEAQKRSI